MRRLLIVALLASCGRSEPSPPASKDAAAPTVEVGCKRTPDPARLRVLEAWRDRAERDPYLALELALDYAQLGADPRALLLRTKAERALEKNDAVLARYKELIARAQRCLPVDPPALAELRAGLREPLQQLRAEIAAAVRGVTGAD